MRVEQKGYKSTSLSVLYMLYDNHTAPAKARGGMRRWDRRRILPHGQLCVVTDQLNDKQVYYISMKIEDCEISIRIFIDGDSPAVGLASNSVPGIRTGRDLELGLFALLNLLQNTEALHYYRNRGSTS